ncbi:MAG: LssY C-terminal domain-containing protein [bacterium]|nr:LssY C-terminal domain-containing protein [Candidatus Sumerlaeota bacterium]
MQKQEPDDTDGRAHRADGRGRRLRLLIFLLILAGAYTVTAYLFMPLDWLRYDKRHPSIEGLSRITYAPAGIPGDPINIGFVGAGDQLLSITLAAKWYPADPLTLRSSLRIALDTVFECPYDDAPVSNLFLYGRREDLAFEFPVGNDPKERHHVRFWKSDQVYDDGRPIWVGSATFDRRVGLSRTTGQITHHIARDIDAERDKLIRDWQATGMLEQVVWVADFHKEREGRNGGGDPWRTDGRAVIGVSKVEAPVRATAIHNITQGADIVSLREHKALSCAIICIDFVEARRLLRILKCPYSGPWISPPTRYVERQRSAFYGPMCVVFGAAGVMLPGMTGCG